MAVRVEPATVHFKGGPLDGTGRSDGDDRDLADATARLVCISTKNGERIPWAVKSVAGTAPDPMQPVITPPHRYVAARSDYVEGRLHIFCEYDGHG